MLVRNTKILRWLMRSVNFLFWCEVNMPRTLAHPLILLYIYLYISSCIQTSLQECPHLREKVPQIPLHSSNLVLRTQPTHQEQEKRKEL